MRKIKSISFLISIILIQSTLAQNYGLKYSAENYSKRCKKFLQKFYQKPPEVQFGLVVDEMDNIIFLFSNKDWYNKFFNSANDGIAVDVVTKDQFGCSSPNIVLKDGFWKGELMTPMYRKELKRNTFFNKDQNGIIEINYGKLNSQYINKDFELNLVFIDNNNVCQYNVFNDTKLLRWNLLDMGMYMDTLTNINIEDTLKLTNTNTSKLSYLAKTFKFVVPFGKNQISYSEEDVKSIHDSLNYTDYYIKKIFIRAYSSVEGTEAKNIEIQQKRAESIIKILQSYQNPTIENEIHVAENWVEFLDDLSTTKYKYFENMSKSEIKELLKDQKLVDELEPYLKKHRKAILTIELDKLTTYKQLSEEKIVILFNSSIKNKDLLKAKEIQNAIFERIHENEFPISVIDKLEIPKELEYASFLNNNTIFRYSKEYDYLRTFIELDELSTLFPKDPKIKYNLCVIKFRLWGTNSPLVEREKFLNEILNLQALKVNQTLVKRMLLNYYIISSEIHMSLHQYDQKNKCLQFINQNYRNSKLTETDVLSLAQYFVSFARKDLAIGLITPYLKKIDINEDLLFYYLNLTLSKSANFKDYVYKKTLLNAVAINKEKFCKLFDTYGKGGMTFQLLENQYLKKMYCENCP